MATETRGERAAALSVYALRWFLGAASLLYLMMYVVIALRRMAYPFDLEWMEGGSVDHVRRLLAGQHLYVAPSLAFVPYCYPPFYYYVSAVIARLTSIGPVPLRFVSFASSLGSFVLLYCFAWKETGERYAGLLAVGLFAATYRIGGAWFDIARIDSLFLFLILSAAYLVRFGHSARAWVAAGLLAALSALTKQTALLIFCPLAIYALLTDWRRSCALLASWAFFLGVTTVALDRAQHGWYLYYVLELPARLQQVNWRRVNFWREDILVRLPEAAGVACAYFVAKIGRRNTASLFYVCFAAGFVGASWVTRMHFGAYDNVLMPAYACLAIIVALASAELPSLGAGRYESYGRALISALCLAQFVSLRYSPTAQIPTADDGAADRNLMAVLAAAPGEVYLVDHGYFSRLAGKRSHAQAQAVDDLLRAGEPELQRQLLDEIHVSLKEHRFQLIVLDRIEPWLREDLDRYYKPASPVSSTDGPRTVTGDHTRPKWLFVPRNQQS